MGGWVRTRDLTAGRERGRLSEMYIHLIIELSYPQNLRALTFSELYSMYSVFVHCRRLYITLRRETEQTEQLGSRFAHERGMSS